MLVLGKGNTDVVGYVFEESYENATHPKIVTLDESISGSYTVYFEEAL